MNKQKNPLLLLEDVDGLGRTGDVVTAKPGFVRNFLLPKKMAVVANKHTLRMQTKLQEERAKRADTDKKEAEALAKKINDLTLEIEVKVDPDGHMYGSVANQDLVTLFAEQGMSVERKNFLLSHAIKTIGEHTINIRLKEGVLASFKLVVNSDIEIVKPVVVEEAALVAEAEAPVEEKTSEEVERFGKNPRKKKKHKEESEE